MTMQIDRRRLLLAVSACVPILMSACSLFGGSKSAPLSDGMLKDMVGALGVSPTQALGGSGALFNIAKSSLSASSFGAVAHVLPGLDGLLANATKAAGGSLPTTMSGATETFQKLGMTPDQVGKVGNYITSYVGKRDGGAAVALKGAWGL